MSKNNKMPGRAQRQTLTYSQMYGAGMQEGKGIFGAIKKWLKKTKIISKIAKFAAPVLGVLPIPGAKVASFGVGLAGLAAKQRGFGHQPRKSKAITARQIQAIRAGLAKVLKSGGLSMVLAKRAFPGIRGVTPGQMRALAAGMGRHMRGGGVSLAGGAATGGRFQTASGVRLAGQGVVLSGGMHVRRPVRRKRRPIAGNKRQQAASASSPHEALTEKQAEAKYFHIYRQMLQEIGHDGSTGNKELDRVGRQFLGAKYLGSFAQDKVPAKIYTKGKHYAIVNVDTAGMSGTHWAGLASLPGSNRVMVFDSFGRATKTLLPLLRQKLLVNTDRDAEQRIVQLSCGQFALAWLVFFDRYGPASAKLI